MNNDNLFVAIADKYGVKDWQSMAIDVIDKLISMLQETTELSQNEIKAYGLLMHDKFLSPKLMFMLKNKKHKDRKAAKEILEVIENIVTMFQNQRPRLLGGIGE